MEQYRINIFTEINTLDYKQFKALLNGLNENTMLSKIIAIRMSKDTSHEMQKLKKQYSLVEPEDSIKKIMEYYR
jgi:cytochrome c553